METGVAPHSPNIVPRSSSNPVQRNNSGKRTSKPPPLPRRDPGTKITSKPPPLSAPPFKINPTVFPPAATKGSTSDNHISRSGTPGTRPLHHQTSDPVGVMDNMDLPPPPPEFLNDALSEMSLSTDNHHNSNFPPTL